MSSFLISVVFPAPRNPEITLIFTLVYSFFLPDNYAGFPYITQQMETVKSRRPGAGTVRYGQIRIYIYIGRKNS